MATTKLDVMASASLVVRLMMVSLVIVRLEIMRLRKRIKKRLSPKICPSLKNCLSPKIQQDRIFLTLELD